MTSIYPSLRREDVNHGTSTLTLYLMYQTLKGVLSLRDDVISNSPCAAPRDWSRRESNPSQCFSKYFLCTGIPAQEPRKWSYVLFFLFANNWFHFLLSMIITKTQPVYTLGSWKNGMKDDLLLEKDATCTKRPARMLYYTCKSGNFRSQVF